MNRNFTICFADSSDRDIIYKLRHKVYADELNQHSPNSDCRLTDSLDKTNIYIVVKFNNKIAGFISITTPQSPSYSIDKYFSREDLFFNFDNKLYEIRLLTVVNHFRGSIVASLLMYAALRWIEENGGNRVVAIGREEIKNIYLKAGLKSLGLKIKSGAVNFELLSCKISCLRSKLDRYAKLIKKIEKNVFWQLEIPFFYQENCFHGGVSIGVIGSEFDKFTERKKVINADVLDAWFLPSPKVIKALDQDFPWQIQTSPPADCKGLIKTIARMRNIDQKCILPGAGSSSLIFLALCRWLNSNSKVLILDPIYGEYTHIVEKVLNCKVDRFILSKDQDYKIDPESFKKKLANSAYDIVIIVNPNSPTGQYIPKLELESILNSVPSNTLVWIDETYIEYVGSNQSLENFATEKQNIVICKSMSKVYALSGLRIAYLCATHKLIRDLKIFSPPWAVSFPAQVAAIAALGDPSYYKERYKETHDLRDKLYEQLNNLEGIHVTRGVANFLLCHFSENSYDLTTFLNQCQKHGLFLRGLNGMGTLIGKQAFRIAVKNQKTNKQMVKIIKTVLDAGKLDVKV